MKNLKTTVTFILAACLAAASVPVSAAADDVEEREFAETGEEYDDSIISDYELSEETGEEVAALDEWEIADGEEVEYDEGYDLVLDGYTLSDDMSGAYLGDEYASSISWPATSKIKTYAVSTKNNTKVYKTADSKDGSYGTIYASDLITIDGYKGSRFKVTYPIKGGTKTGWIEKSDVTSAAINTAKSKYNAKSQITTYRRSNGAEELGYISKGDTVYEIASSGNYTQVIYPISGGYKMGWINNNVATVDNDITARLNNMMSGSYGGGAYKLGKKYTGPYYKEQCKGFAKQIHKELFGYLIGSTNPKPKNYTIAISSANTKLVGSVTSMTESNLKNIFTQARPGDFVQIRRRHTGSHSAIVVSASSNGITMYEANLDGKNTISKNTYTWKQLIDKNAAMSLYTAKDYRLH